LKVIKAIIIIRRCETPFHNVLGTEMYMTNRLSGTRGTRVFESWSCVIDGCQARCEMANSSWLCMCVLQNDRNEGGSIWVCIEFICHTQRPIIQLRSDSTTRIVRDFEVSLIERDPSSCICVLKESWRRKLCLPRVMSISGERERKVHYKTAIIRGKRRLW